MRAVRAFAWIVGLYWAFCLVLAILLGEFAFRAPSMPVGNRASAQAAASEAGFALEDISVTAEDGVRLEGWRSRPAGANGNAVILLHGISDSRQTMIGFARVFLSAGYAVLLPDSRGHGSSGGFPTYGVKEAGDVGLWYEWLTERDQPRCIFGLGESLGAAILLQAAMTVPFCAVVAESPFATFREVSYLRVGQFLHTGDWAGRLALRPSVELAFLYGRLTRGVGLAGVSPASAVEGCRVPILLIHGFADTNIPIRHSEIIRAHNPGYVSLWSVPGAGHTQASKVARNEFHNRVLNWFALHGK